MSTQVQHRRGTAVQHEAFTGAMSEITHDTTTNNIRVHDGQKPGGYATLMEDQLGVTGGVASLDETGLVPEPQLGNTYSALGEYLGAPNGIATLDSTGNVPEAQLGNVPKSYDYASTTALSEAEVPSAITYVRTAGYSTVGDGGGALYKRVSSEPSHAGKVKSADGAWWELVSDNGAVTARSFGAKGDLTTDDTASLNGALGYIVAKDGGTLRLGIGRYKTTAALTYSGASSAQGSIVIEGESNLLSQIWCFGTGHGLSINLPTPTSNNKSARAELKNIAVIADAAKPSGGSAIKIVGLGGSYSVIPGTNLVEVLTTQEGSAYWQYGVELQDVGDVTMNCPKLYHIGDDTTASLYIHNGVTAASYGFRIWGPQINGGQTGMLVTGAMESFMIKDGIILGRDALRMTAVGTTYGAPHLVIEGTHLNAKRNTIELRDWRAISIHGADIYSGIGVGDEAGFNLYINNASGVQISASKIEMGAPSNSRDGIVLSEVTDFALSGCTFRNISNTGISVSGSSSRRGAITGNVVSGYADGTPNGTGIYIAGVHADGSFSVTGNTIYYFGQATTAAANLSLVVGNVASYCTAGYAVTGTQSIAANNIG